VCCFFSGEKGSGAEGEMNRECNQRKRRSKTESGVVFLREIEEVLVKKMFTTKRMCFLFFEGDKNLEENEGDKQ